MSTVRVCASASSSSAMRAASRATATNIGIATNQSHRCVLVRHARQSWPVFAERSTLQLPKSLSAKSFHTFTKERLGTSVSSSSSYAALHSVPLQFRLQTRSFFFWSYADATNSNVDKDSAPPNSSKETTSSSLADENVTLCDSPSPLSISTTIPSPLLEQPEKKEALKSNDTVSGYRDDDYKNMTERYIHMNVLEVRPSQNDLYLMKLCIQFWCKEHTFEAWRNKIV
jgi:hypothetical protein